MKVENKNESCSDGTRPVENLCFDPVGKDYVKVVVIRIALVYGILMALALLISQIDFSHALIITIAAECVLGAAFFVNAAFARKIYRLRGYALRDRDISYRSGIFFTAVTTIPFCRIQQVSVRLNPVSRIFGLYYLDIINGAQSAMNRVTIPGLSLAKAEGLKTLLIRKSGCCDE